MASKFETAYLKDGVYSPDEKFKKISENFLMIFSENKLKETLREIADNNKESITELTSTLIDMLYDYDTEARGYLGEVQYGIVSISYIQFIMLMKLILFLNTHRRYLI